MVLAENASALDTEEPSLIRSQLGGASHGTRHNRQAMLVSVRRGQG